ncbi:helix-turn-helix transcriptional regulator [Cytobacillus pseudoceanisediminis]|uniref:Helix-turn-helix transcriptional regulator n=1 Tax=Cytobacillus pseudoceanisediminis TaxID=3051614 RepID=A0ABZ2ZH24_9BACI
MEYKCKLKMILADKEIKHGDFAKKINMSAAGLSAIVNNRALPSFDSAYRICEVLNLHPRDIWIKNKGEE